MTQCPQLPRHGSQHLLDKARKYQCRAIQVRCASSTWQRFTWADVLFSVPPDVPTLMLLHKARASRWSLAAASPPSAVPVPALRYVFSVSTHEVATDCRGTAIAHVDFRRCGRAPQRLPSVSWRVAVGFPQPSHLRLWHIRRLQRHHIGIEPWVQHQWLYSRRWMGPGECGRCDSERPQNRRRSRPGTRSLY